VVTLAFSAMEATYAFLAHRHFGLGDRHVSWLFTYIGVIVVLVQGGLIGRSRGASGEAAARGRNHPPGSGAGRAALRERGAGPAAGLRPAGLRVGALESQHHVAALPVQPAEDQGGTLGIGQSASALGRIVGPLAGTTSFAAWQAAPYLGGAALMVVGAAVGATVSVPKNTDGPARGAVTTAS